MPASSAAPYCLSVDAAVDAETAEGTKQASAGSAADGVDVVTLLGLFGSPEVGRHWSCGPVVPDARAKLLREAAAAVLQAACRFGDLGVALGPHGVDGGDLGDAAIRRAVLAPGLVAPAVWIEGSGKLNARLLRFLSLRFMQLLAKSPGLTAKEIAKQTGMLDECEVALVLRGLNYAGALDTSLFSSTTSASSASASSRDNYYARPLHVLVAEAEGVH